MNRPALADKLERGHANGICRRPHHDQFTAHPEAVNEPPPSSVTRSTPTPPTPADTKPLVQSKSFVTTAVAGVTTATVAVGEVSKAVSPYAEQSELVGKAVMVLATIGAVLAVAALVLLWMKRKRA